MNYINHSILFDSLHKFTRKVLIIYIYGHNDVTYDQIMTWYCWHCSNWYFYMNKDIRYRPQVDKVDVLINPRRMYLWRQSDVRFCPSSNIFLTKKWCNYYRRSSLFALQIASKKPNVNFKCLLLVTWGP